jgi:hypothetical protein
MVNIGTFLNYVCSRKTGCPFGKNIKRKARSDKNRLLHVNYQNPAIWKTDSGIFAIVLVWKVKKILKYGQGK